MILVIGSFTASSGSFEQALALSRTHVARSRAEPGCISHDVHFDAEDHNRLVFIEQWNDAAALQAHFKVPASRKFVHSIGQLSSVAPTMTIYDASPIKL
ncbi:MAG TPA: putative quinol monooxygenase [Steroidobacteraceae bacterium]|nr:putative quinol monooxygenase [Steroidobacteraceae bacterium]